VDSERAASGRLLSLEVVDGRDAVSAAKSLLLKSHSDDNGISTWDASGIFFEMGGVELDTKPSARTLILLYAADLSFRLRWQILPALEEGKCVVAVPYVETAYALAAISRLPAKWATELFRFAPAPAAVFRAERGSGLLGPPASGFVEFCSGIFGQDLRPKFHSYFADLENRGGCRSL